MSNSPENLQRGPELNNDSLPNREMLDQYKHEEEKNLDEVTESTEQLREKAIDLATEEQSSKSPERDDKSEKHGTARGPISKKRRQENYERVVNIVQSELPKSSKKFSKFIHNPAIEKTSDLVGSTIMRPRPLLAASILGFILPLICYLIAKEMGYKLSGSESIIAMLVGFIIGLIMDYLRLLIGKK